MLERGSLGNSFGYCVSSFLRFARVVFNGFDTENEDDEATGFIDAPKRKSKCVFKLRKGLGRDYVRLSSN